MVDYYWEIARAVADLEIETAETRAAVYVNARAAQSAQLRAMSPPPAFAERRLERISLEQVISRIEAESVSKQQHAEVDEDLFAPSVASSQTWSRAAVVLKAAGAAILGIAGFVLVAFWFVHKT